MYDQQTMTPPLDAGARFAPGHRLRTDAPAVDRPAALDPQGGPGPVRAALHADPEVIVFNLKRRYTGVSATVNALVPVQLSQWRLGYCGERLSNGLPGMSLRQAVSLSRRPPRDRAFRIWHVRRDHEMAAALFARDVLRLPIRIVFTSAAQHRHGAFPRWLISRMDAVVATTPLAAAFVPNTTATVAHGVDLQRFTVAADKRAAWATSGLPGQFGIGVFGRIRPDKGTDVFIDAMVRALPQLLGAHAVVAGLAKPEHQDFLRALQARIAQAGLSDRISFIGEIPAHDIHHWYQRCLVCVACPRYEPFGLTPFEAAASGCALVCSRTGAFAQLVEPGVTGTLVPVGEATALADAVIDLMSDPERAMRLGHNARHAVAQRFSVQTEAAGIAGVYRSLFEGH